MTAPSLTDLLAHLRRLGAPYETAGLAKAVAHAMALGGLRVAAVVLALGLAGAGTGVLTYQGPAAGAADGPADGAAGRSGAPGVGGAVDERPPDTAALVQGWEQTASQRLRANPATAALAAKYPLVVLHARRLAVPPGSSGRSAFSFVHEAADPARHGNDVQLLFDSAGNGPAFTINLATDQQNLIADLGDVDFARDPDPRKVDVDGDSPNTWVPAGCRAVEGHVYLERVRDGRGNRFYALFRVVTVDKDGRYVAFVWRRLPGGKVVRAGGRTPDAAQIERLVGQLASPRFAERDAAAKRLLAIGDPAVGALRAAEARKGADLELRRRAGQLADGLEADALPRLLRAAIWLEERKEYQQAAALLDAVIAKAHLRYQAGPPIPAGGVPFLADAFLHSARVRRQLGEYEKAARAYEQAEAYLGNDGDDDKRDEIRHERGTLVGDLVASWRRAVERQVASDAGLKRLAAEHPLVLLHSRRYAPGRYRQCAYSFLYRTTVERLHYNDVQLLFDNNRPCTLQLNMLVGQKNRAADLGKTDFRKDPNPGRVPDGSWQPDEVKAVAGHVYLEHVADAAGNDFYVLFQVVAVDPDSRYVAFLWRQLPGGKVVRRP